MIDLKFLFCSYKVLYLVCKFIFQLQKLKLADVLNKAADRMKEQDKDFGSQKAEYEREMKHLRLLLRERDDHVELLSGEKRCV